jgi:hypothetical protein
VRRVASRNGALVDLGKGAVAIQTSLVAFVVGGSFVPFQYNEILWHVIGLSMVLRRLAAQQEQVLATQLMIKEPPFPLRDPFAA